MKNEDIKILYESGLTIQEIAEKVNLSYEKTRQILKNQKIKWSRNYVSDLTSKQIEDILRKFDDGITIKDLSRWYELSEPAISRLLKSKNRNFVYSNRKYDILRQTPINSIQKQIIVGCLLGNGSLHKDSQKGNFKLSFNHSEAQEQYFHWKVAMLDPFINTYRKGFDERKKSVMLQTATICHQDLNMFANMFYDESRVKHIPNNLDIYLTPLSLAVWVMDDGNINSGVNMRIASMNFSESENYKLRDYLKMSFDLRSKVMEYTYSGKKYYQIVLNKRNTQKLSDIIRPHVNDCMKHKLMPESSTTTCRTHKSEDDIV